MKSDQKQESDGKRSVERRASCDSEKSENKPKDNENILDKESPPEPKPSSTHTDDEKKTFAEEFPDTTVVKLDPPSFLKTPPPQANRKQINDAKDSEKKTFAEEFPDSPAVKLEPPSFVKTPSDNLQIDKKKAFAEEFPGTSIVRLKPKPFASTPPRHIKKQDCSSEFAEEFPNTFDTGPLSFKKGNRQKHDAQAGSDKFAEEFPSTSVRLEPPSCVENSLQDYKRPLNDEVCQTNLERQSHVQPGAFRVSGMSGSGGDDDEDESYYREAIQQNEIVFNADEISENPDPESNIPEMASEKPTKALPLWRRYRCVIICSAIVLVGIIAIVVSITTTASVSPTIPSSQNESSVPQSDPSSTIDYVMMFGKNYSIDSNRLDLAKQDLIGTIPSEIGFLVNLEYVLLDENELSGPIPSEIGLLTMLNMLWLQNNALEGDVPSEIGLLTSLTSLYLFNNDIFSLPAEVDQLLKVKMNPLQPLSN